MIDREQEMKDEMAHLPPIEEEYVDNKCLVELEEYMYLIKNWGEYSKEQEIDIREAFIYAFERGMARGAAIFEQTASKEFSNSRKNG